MVDWPVALGPVLSQYIMVGVSGRKSYSWQLGSKDSKEAEVPISPSRTCPTPFFHPLNGLGTLAEKSIDHKNLGLFLDSLLDSIGLYI